jgi:hypothetical protein
VPRRGGAPVRIFMEMTGLSSGHHILARSRRLPRTGYSRDCWDAKIFPKNRQDKFLIRRQEAFRERLNPPGLEIRRREFDMVKALIDAPGALLQRKCNKTWVSTRPDFFRTGFFSFRDSSYKNHWLHRSTSRHGSSGGDIPGTGSRRPPSTKRNSQNLSGSFSKWRHEPGDGQ